MTVEGIPRSAPHLLAEPLPARLLGALRRVRRPATTQELAELLGRHPNTIRANLLRLESAGLVDRQTTPRPRGRPRDEWTVVAGDPEPQEPNADLARWLARALRTTGELEAIEETGREIGRELAPASGAGTGTAAASFQSALATMGFAPREERADDRRRFVLQNCPYRDAARENQPVVCALHRGITRGLLDRLMPDTQLAAFLPRDPDDAGCLVDLRKRQATD